MSKPIRSTTLARVYGTAKTCQSQVAEDLKPRWVNWTSNPYQSADKTQHGLEQGPQPEPLALRRNNANPTGGTRSPLASAAWQSAR